MSDVIIAASLSFGAALIAVVIGQVLAGRYQSVTEQRKWQREDAARWRIRSEEMAREAIDRLSVATDVVGWNGGKERAKKLGLEGHHWIEPDIGDVTALVRPVRRAALEIDHADIREHLDKGTELLVNGHAARSFGAAYLPRLTWAVQTTSEALIGAYLRGSALPSRLDGDGALRENWQVFDQSYRAVEELHETYDHEVDEADFEVAPTPTV